MASVDRWRGNKWRARWRGPDGESRSQVFDRKVDAENHLTSVQHSKLTGAYVDPAAGKVTFKAYAEEWSERQVWRSSTAEAMGYCLGRAYDAFGSKPIASVRQSDLQKFVRALTDAKLAPRTVEASYRAASMVFKARRHRLRHRGVAVRVGAAAEDRPAEGEAARVGRGGGSGGRDPAAATRARAVHGGDGNEDQRGNRAHR